VATASPAGPWPLPPDARLVGESHRVLRTHSHSARLIPKRSSIPAPAQGFPLDYLGNSNQHGTPCVWAVIRLLYLGCRWYRAADTKPPIRTRYAKGVGPKAKTEEQGKGVIERNYLSEKFTSIFKATSTGTPFFIPGRNFHCLNAWMAFSSNPRPRPRTTFKISIVPSLRTMADSTTTP